MVKGEKGCESGHIDDGVLYKAFVYMFNMMVENRESFVGKWRERLENGNSLERYRAKQFIGVITDAEVINEFDMELYFVMVEKMTILDGGRLIVSLLDGTEIECGV